MRNIAAKWGNIYVGHFAGSLPTNDTKQRLEVCGCVSISYWCKEGFREGLIYKLIYLEFSDFLSYVLLSLPSSYLTYSLKLLLPLGSWRK